MEVAFIAGLCLGGAIGLSVGVLWFVRVRRVAVWPAKRRQVEWRVGTSSKSEIGTVYLDRGTGTGSCIARCYYPEMAQYIVDACNAYAASAREPKP